MSSLPARIGFLTLHPTTHHVPPVVHLVPPKVHFIPPKVHSVPPKVHLVPLASPPLCRPESRNRLEQLGPPDPERDPNGCGDQPGEQRRASAQQ
eukprot:7814784-Pyramimonas_sp.AAC.1